MEVILANIWIFKDIFCFCCLFRRRLVRRGPLVFAFWPLHHPLLTNQMEWCNNTKLMKKVIDGILTSTLHNYTAVYCQGNQNLCISPCSSRGYYHKKGFESQFWLVLHKKNMQCRFISLSQRRNNDFMMTAEAVLASVGTLHMFTQLMMWVQNY